MMWLRDELKLGSDYMATASLVEKWVSPSSRPAAPLWCDVERVVCVTMSLTKSQLIVKWD